MDQKTLKLCESLFGKEPKPDYYKKLLRNSDSHHKLLWDSGRERAGDREQSCCKRVVAKWVDPPKQEVENYMKGIVINNERVIAVGFPETVEVDVSDINDVFGNDEILIPPEVRVTFAPEGQLVRIYYSEKAGKWMFSSNKMLDARNSRWGVLSLGETWDYLWGDEDFDSYLCRNRCYVFLMSTIANRMICENKDELYLVAVLKRTKSGSMIYCTTEETKLRKPHHNLSRLRFIPNVPGRKVGDLKAFMEKVSSNLEYTGILVFNALGSDFRLVECTKIINRKYNKLASLRGTEGNIHAQYVKLLTSHRELYPGYRNQLDEFLKFYPEFKNAKLIEANLDAFIKFILAGNLDSRNYEGYKSEILYRAYQERKASEQRYQQELEELYAVCDEEKRKPTSFELDVLDTLCMSNEESIRRGIRTLDRKDLVDLADDLIDERKIFNSKGSIIAHCGQFVIVF